MSICSQTSDKICLIEPFLESAEPTNGRRWRLLHKIYDARWTYLLKHFVKEILSISGTTQLRLDENFQICENRLLIVGLRVFAKLWSAQLKICLVFFMKRLFQFVFDIYSYVIFLCDKNKKYIELYCNFFGHISLNVDKSIAVHFNMKNTTIQDQEFSMCKICKVPFQKLTCNDHVNHTFSQLTSYFFVIWNLSNTVSIKVSKVFVCENAVSTTEDLPPFSMKQLFQFVLIFIHMVYFYLIKINIEHRYNLIGSSVTFV